MLKGFLGSIFRHTPKALRRLFSRVTNPRFAVTAGSAVSAETLLEAGAALVVGRLDELRAELD